MTTSPAQFLKSVKIQDTLGLTRFGKVLAVSSNSTIKEAFDVLLRYNILSAPVWDEVNNVVIGLVDMMDIVAMVVDVYQEAESVGTLTFEEMLQEVIRRGYSTDVADLSQRNPFIPVKHSATLFDVALVLGRHGVHRVCVLDDNGQLVNFITQSALVELLRLNAGKMGPVLLKSIAELGLITSPVLSVQSTQRAIDAFKVIKEKGVSAVAVVDPSNLLIGTISVRDIRILLQTPNSFRRIYQPLTTFLHAIHEEEVIETAPAINTKPTDSLADVITKISFNKIHRIFVEQNKHLHGIITLTDILRVVTTI